VNLGTFFFPSHDSPYWAKASSFSRLHVHTQTHHSRQDSSGRVTSPTQKLLSDNTKQPQAIDIHPPAEFEIAIPAIQRPQTHALDSAATG